MCTETNRNTTPRSLHVAPEGYFNSYGATQLPDYDDFI